jgi:hypothetical protein
MIGGRDVHLSCVSPSGKIRKKAFKKAPVEKDKKELRVSFDPDNPHSLISKEKV